MTRWPWITALIAAILALNPLGLEIFRLAFVSGEQLSRNIWQPLYLISVAVMVALALLEWGIRTMIARRRARPAQATET